MIGRSEPVKKPTVSVNVSDYYWDCLSAINDEKALMNFIKIPSYFNGLIYHFPDIAYQIYRIFNCPLFLTTITPQEIEKALAPLYEKNPYKIEVFFTRPEYYRNSLEDFYNNFSQKIQENPAYFAISCQSTTPILQRFILSNLMCRKEIIKHLNTAKQKEDFIQLLKEFFPHKLSPILPNQSDSTSYEVFENPETIYRVARKLTATDDQKVVADLPFKDMIFCTFVIADGFGDLINCILTAVLWKKVYPALKIQVFAFLDDFDKRINQATLIASAFQPLSLKCSLFDSGIIKLEEDFAIPDFGLPALSLYDVNSSEVFDTFEKACQALDKTDAIFEVLTKNNSLKARLVSMGYSSKYHAYWLEASTRAGFDSSPCSLFGYEWDIASNRMRIGLELGICIDESLQPLKNTLCDLTFEEKVARLESVKLKEILLTKPKKYNAHMYMGYIRTVNNLMTFCVLLGTLHQKKRDVINVYVKDIPPQKGIDFLLRLNTFATIIIDDGNKHAKQLLYGSQRLTGKPILRLIKTPISYTDSNLIVAMSSIVACGGDRSYFQALSFNTLPFMERMIHDDSFYPFVIYLADKYVPQGQLANYFRETFLLTSLAINFTECFDSFNTFSIIQTQVAKIYNLLKGDGKTQLEKEYQILINAIGEFHNLEKSIRHFPT